MATIMSCFMMSAVTITAAKEKVLSGDVLTPAFFFRFTSQERKALYLSQASKICTI